MTSKIQSKCRYWAVIPAAGMSTRMGMPLPKQYVSLIDNTTVLERALRHFVHHEKVKRIVVALAKEDAHWKGSGIAKHSKIMTVQGGVQRVNSVFSALTALAPYAANEDWVLVHDAARPCLTSRALNRLMDTLTQVNHPVGGVLAIPVTDTIKQAMQTSQQIQKSVSRNRLWLAQTPQMFRFKRLYQAIRDALNPENDCTVTDESAALEWQGHHPLLILGDQYNVKLTYPEDITWVNMILAHQEKLL